MKKWFILVFTIILLLVPTLVSAQNTVKFAEVGIELWSEYDTPEMLAMYSFALTEDSVLPAEVKIRIPANAELNAVAKLSEGEMLTLPYEPLILDGDDQILTLIADEQTLYRVEYYAPLEKDGVRRDFSLVWESEYDVEALFVELLEPPDVSNLSSTPAFNDTGAENGMTLHALSAGEIKAGDVFELAISYDKASDNLTVSSMSVEVGGVPESEESSFSLKDSLPMILVGVGIALILGGLLYFFLAGRGGDSSTEKRKRHKPSGEVKYCHECGSRSSGNDKFCRACGVKLRK